MSKGPKIRDCTACVHTEIVEPPADRPGATRRCKKHNCWTGPTVSNCSAFKRANPEKLS